MDALPLFRAMYAPRGFPTAGERAPRGTSAVYRYIRRYCRDARTVMVERAYGDPLAPDWRASSALSFERPQRISA